VRLRAEIFAAVAAVPRGGVVGYGDVARACGTIPVVVGKALAHCGPGVPWQRVVGTDGSLRTARRGPEFAARQRALLEGEGIAFDAEGRVPPAEPGWERGRAALAAWLRATAEGAPKGKPVRAPNGGLRRLEQAETANWTGARESPRRAGSITTE
jgi:methylated-DNA-protein-cysteine methyltransferase-like protein